MCCEVKKQRDSIFVKLFSHHQLIAMQYVLPLCKTLLIIDGTTCGTLIFALSGSSIVSSDKQSTYRKRIVSLASVLS